jgi:hypothetical protein
MNNKKNDDKDVMDHAAKWFNSPKALIRFLDKAGFNTFEVTSILDSMWLGEAVTEFGAGAGKGKGNTGTMKAFLNAHCISPKCDKVNKLVLSKVKGSVANEDGVPCFEGTMPGNPEAGKVKVALGTPISCDPTSETYWSM